jgi:hypothetical protein
MKKIFISIVGYRDPLLYNTILEAYKNAKNKDSLVFGIVDQSYAWESIDFNSLPFGSQIRYMRIDPQYARGVCWARSMAQSLFCEEDYFLQVDSHTLFDEFWDLVLLEQYNEIRLYHEKPVISQYPHAFEAIDNNILNLKKTKYDGLMALIADEENSFIPQADYDNYYVGTKTHIIDKYKPVHGYMMGANFLFAGGSIVEDGPYDPFLFFSGEEHSLALRYYTHGYNIFHIRDIPVYHYYGRDYRVTMWGDDKVQEKKKDGQKWWEMDKISKARLKNIVCGKVGTYGLGNKRTLEQYINWCGIDYFSKILEPKSKTGELIFEIDYKDKI